VDGASTSRDGVSRSRLVAAARDRSLDRFRLAHRALPGRDLAEVSLRTRLLGADLSAPVLVVAAEADRDVARAATEHGFGLIVRSGHAPDRPPLLLAGADFAALRRVGPEQAERLVSMLDADGLAIDLGAVTEALRPGGDPLMRDAGEAIAAVVDRLAPLPVVVRDPGYGMDAADVRELRNAGAAAVGVGGAGGAGDPAFAPWGVPVADAIAEAVLAAPELPVIASDVLDGVEAAKCLALGATAVSVAAADDLAALVHQLRVAVWATGEPAAAALTQGHLRA
jgi:isopentenyl-diphosphate delta-isomerase